MADDITDWSELREFKAIDLTASYVLSWHRDGNSLLIDMDLCLLPEHALYEEPRRAGEACIWPAALEFPYCNRLIADSGEGDEKSFGALAERLGLGRISNLEKTREGRYRLRGRFGTVQINAERPILRLGTVHPPAR